MTAERRILGELGVGPDAEHAYRALLDDPGLTTSELSQHVDFGLTRLRAALSELERLAMVTRLSGTPARFQPTPPDVVVESLAISREEALRRTQLEAREQLTLRRRRPGQVDVTEIVEVLTTREGYAQRWTQAQSATQERLELFVRPPFTRPLTPADEELQRKMLQRGVRSRCLYDHDALAYPGILEHMWRMVQAGEQARVVTRLPMKLVLSDRRIGLVPFIQEDPERTADSGLEVHRSALLDALIALFDVFWERGTDVRRGEIPAEDHTVGRDEDEVLTLLAGGLKDEAIARRLGVSVQTVRRRIRAMQQRLGVTTRFQAGLAIGRRDQQQHAPDGGASAASHPTTSR
jgi:hypothetical protein